MTFEAAQSTGDSGAVTPMPPTARAAVSNGSRLLPDCDGRTRHARRLRDVLDALIEEFDACTEGKLSLCRRAAGLSVWLEQQEALIASGAAIDIAATTTATNSLRRLLSDLAGRRRRRGGAK